MKEQKIEHLCFNKSKKEITYGLNIDKEGKVFEIKNILNKESTTNRYGEAFNYCYGIDNKLYITNGEYESEVKYCPICGFSND